MESLTRTIDQAIRDKDYNTLSSVFASDAASAGQSWNMIGQGEKRSLAAYFIQAVITTPNFLPQAFEHTDDAIWLNVLGHLPASVENAADNALRSLLFDYKIQNTDEYGDAARILGGTRMEAEGVYAVSPYDKLDVYVKMAECFLEEDEIVEADNAVNKAGQVAPFVSSANNAANNDKTGEDSNDQQQQQQKKVVSLLLRYKSTYARVLDANRKFLQAAQRYHDLSQQSEHCDEDDLIQLLGRAVTCAILAPSGPQRQRTLQHLYQDLRLNQLDPLPEFSTHSTILSKMYHHQILHPKELVQFEQSLSDHQKAIMGDGLSIMERGIVEHNVTSVARLYRTIYLTELANILGITSTQKATKIVSDMILDGTIHGSIDQVDGLLQFDITESSDTTWDRSISSFCIQLNSITDSIKQQQQISTGAGK